MTTERLPGVALEMKDPRSSAVDPSDCQSFCRREEIIPHYVAAPEHIGHN